MKFLSLAVLVLGVLASSSPALAHGSAYPRDVSPPNPPPAAPPTDVGPNGPRAGTRSGSAGAAGPTVVQPTGGNSSGGAPMPSFGGAPGVPGIGPDEASASAWVQWWRFHRDTFLPARGSLRGAFDDGSPEADAMRERVRREVTPLLTKALREETSDDIRSGCLIALARLGDLSDSRSTLREAIQPLLASPSQELAETAAVSLGLLGDRASIDVLREIVLGDADALRKRGLAGASTITHRSRAFAAYGLGLLGERASHVERSLLVATLVGWMDTEGASSAQADLPAACVVAIAMLPLPVDGRRATFGDWPVGQRPERVDSRDAQILWMLYVLGERTHSSLVRAQIPTAAVRLLEGLPRQHWLRMVVARELCARLEARADEPVEIQAGCVLALGDLADCGREAESVLARKTLLTVRQRRRDPQLTGLALVSYARIAGRPGAGAEPWFALEAKEEAPRAVLLAALREDSANLRPIDAIAVALLERGARDGGAQPSSESLAALRAALSAAKSPDEVAALSIAAGIAADGSATEVLRKKLAQVADPSARGCIALALGMLDDAAAQPKLIEQLQLSRFQPEMLTSVATALRSLAPLEAESALLARLSKASSASLKSTCALGLAEVGGARSLDSLMAEVRREDQPALARALAVVALGRVCDPAALPWIAAVSTRINYVGAPPTLVSPASGDGLLDLF